MKSVLLLIAFLLYPSAALKADLIPADYSHQKRALKSSLLKTSTSEKRKSKIGNGLDFSIVQEESGDKSETMFTVKDNPNEVKTTSRFPYLANGPTHSPRKAKQPTLNPVATPSPTVLRTRSPTVTPTMAPTAAENFIMSVTQDLNGITSSKFQETSANSEAFAGAVADCLNGINASLVVIQSVTDTASAVISLPVHLRRLQTGSINIDYTIEYNIATLGYSDNPDGAYDNLVTTLTNAVADNTFNTNLASNAVSSGATDLIAVTSSNVSSSGYTAAADDDDGDNNGSNDDLVEQDTIIIAVVVAVGGFVLFVCIIIAYIMCCGGGSSANAGGDTSEHYYAVNSEHAIVVPASAPPEEHVKAESQI